ncbi:expressed tetratricopeptide repeat protein [Nitzschia inconspicua]|uniref:Tetratricopeptide repeat protein n=1 Tax=Nitzschia inconspicua TaxID=303405 RepID=A0A9K3M0P8_9STRA|nr:tetratricopeptide repeat protein [Nitzschia inconspicua]KAG7371574.1 expressed tetratricopeptide repeat protein [Nitzschia inconspicua]
MLQNMVSLPGTTVCITGMTATALQSISEQNNMGVSLYNQGRFDEAVRVFKEATSASKTFLSGPMEMERTTTAVVMSTSLQVLPSKTALTKDMDSLIDRSVFLKPFEVVLILGDRQMVNPIYKENCQDRLFFSRLSTILIFNMALTHHAMAMVSRDEDSKSKREFLSKAMDLYNLAYSIPQEEQEQEVIEETILPLFVKAVLNNLGHCFSSMNDTNNSMACYELLLRSIIIFQQDHHIQCRNNSGESSNENFSTDHSSTACCFLNNTLFLILKDPGLAPAA